MDKSTIARFLSKVNKYGRLMPGMKTRCHEWVGWKAHGYGYFWLNGKSKRAHRVAFFIKHGRWPNPQALHRCDNPACVRVSHLEEGNQQKNIRDMYAKKRGVGFGANMAHPNARLTDAQITSLRTRYAAGGVYQKELALEYGISVDYANKILTGKNRKSGVLVNEDC